MSENGNDKKKVVADGFVGDGVKTTEDDVVKIEFVFKDGYLTTINVNVKDRDFVPQVDLSKKQKLMPWVNGASRSVINMLSNLPNDRTDVGTSGIEVVHSGENMPPMPPRDGVNHTRDPICPRCNIPLKFKEPCCGGSGEILECERCKLRVKHRK